MSNKIKIKVPFYKMNQRLKINEVELLDVAMKMVNESPEQFLRKATLDRAANLLVDYYEKNKEPTNGIREAEESKEGSREGTTTSDSAVEESHEGAERSGDPVQGDSE